MTYLVTAFYHFADFPDFADHKPRLKEAMASAGIRGTILLAPEGINGTIAGPEAPLRELIGLLREDARFQTMVVKESYSEHLPFNRAKVRLKREIIGMGVAVDPAHGEGTHLSPREWNQLLQDPEVILLDSRNDYEVHLGKFRRAIDPEISNFKELPPYVREHLNPQQHKKIATYCTGGIRCEKFAAYLKDEGFEEVYQLQGGILKYLEDIPPEESLWEGECYVFDHRVSIAHGLAASQHNTACMACGHPLTPDDRAHPDYAEGEHCPHCDDEG